MKIFLHSSYFNFTKISIYNLKVDEIEDANYSDTSFWKGISHNVLNSKDLDKMMADLEL